MSNPNLCFQCGAALDRAERSTGEGLCGRCQGASHPDDLDEVVAVQPAEEGEEIEEAVAVDEPASAAGRTGRPSRTGRSGGGMAAWVAYRSTGFTHCKGVAVLRPETVAFIPTQEQVNILGAMAGQAATAMTGIHRISLSWLQRKRNILHLVEDLWEDYRDDFDEYIADLVGVHGGDLWSRSECKVTHVRPRKPTGKHGLTFRTDKAEFQGPVADGRHLDRLLEGWRHAPPSPRTAVKLSVALSIIPGVLTIVAVFMAISGNVPIAAPIVWACFTLLAWAPALAAWIRWKRHKE